MPSLKELISSRKSATIVVSEKDLEKGPNHASFRRTMDAITPKSETHQLPGDWARDASKDAKPPVEFPIRMKGLLAVREERETALAIPDDTVVLAWLDTSALGNAFSASGWTLDREVEILAGIAQDPEESARNKILAADTLHARRMEALRYSGRLAALSSTRTQVNSDGSTTTTQTNELRAVGVIQAGTPASTEAALREAVSSRPSPRRLPQETPDAVPNSS